MILQRQRKGSERIYVNLPETECRVLGWKPGDTVVAQVDTKKGTLTLIKVKKPKGEK